MSDEVIKMNQFNNKIYSFLNCNNTNSSIDVDILHKIIFRYSILGL